MRRFLFFVLVLAAGILSGCSRPSGDEPENPSGGNGGNEGGGSSSTSVAVNGCLPGKFSVSPSDKVSFSQGNLLYQASGNRFRFHAKQYQIVGGEYYGSVFHDGIRSRNEDTSKDYDGWIDLFAWGSANQPWARGDAAYSLTTYHEWGDKAIENGGNSNAWRMLSASEWQYLLKERPKAEYKVGVCVLKKAMYTNIYLERNSLTEGYADHDALMLIPDTWTCPSGITFISVAEQANWTWMNSNSEWDDHGLGWWLNSSSGYTIANEYKISEMEKLEASGVVFLPATGFVWSDGHYSYSTNDGDYWTCNEYEDPMNPSINYAYAMQFTCLYPANISPAESAVISGGKAIRLVKDVK